MTTLVERLRDAMNPWKDSTMVEAADRIEELEKVCAMALEAMSGLSQGTVDEMTGVEFNETQEAITALRNVLGEKT